MTNEIKEILDKLNENKDYDDYVDYKGSYFKPLLDCITNLQEELEEEKRIEQKDLETIQRLEEENERLKKAVKENVIATCNTCEWFGVCPHSYKEYDYKAQIDKAIEVIDLIIPELWNISNKMTYRLKDVKNILRGDE